MTNNQQKYALITGANGGIGQALCETFTEEGYKVIATDMHERPIESLKFEEYISIDLNKLVENDSYATERKEVIKSFLTENKLHALINNAAVQILGGVDSLSREDWSQTLNINLQAPFLLAQSFINELEHSKGSIVNISSIHAKLTKKNFVAYATSKAALSGMTRAMAVDLGPRVRVNAIEPAAIATEMLRKGFNGDVDKIKSLKSCHPSQAIADVKDISKIIFCLMDQGFNQFLHGSCISISGGIDCRLFDPE